MRVGRLSQRNLRVHPGLGGNDLPEEQGFQLSGGSSAGSAGFRVALGADCALSGSALAMAIRRAGGRRFGRCLYRDAPGRCPKRHP